MKKKLFSIIVIMAIVQSAYAWHNFSAVAPSGQTLYYTINSDNTVYVTYPGEQPGSYGGMTGYIAPTGNLVIPSSVTCNGVSYPVTSIGYGAFKYCYGLTSVTIPNSVTSIGNEAFSNCTGLTSVTFNADSCISEGDDLFEVCPNINTFTFGNNVKRIPSYLCYGLAGLTSVTIPNSVTSIGYCAFCYCTGLTSVTIPNSVSNIDYGAFLDCTGLTSVAFNADSCASAGTEDWSIYGPFIRCTNIDTFTFGNNVKIIPSYLLSGMTDLTSITIPNSVTSIGSYAFYECTGLTSVTIPNSVTNIGDRAFFGCTGLASVTIPNSVTSIGNSVFNGCTGLTSLTIPNWVTSIGGGAFANCTGLTTLTIPNSVKNIGSGAFSYCTSLESFFLNADSCVFEGYSYGGQYHGAFYGCSFLSSVIIGDSITYICENAFKNCDQLINITLGSGVQSISQGVFNGCTSLARIKSYATQPPLVQSNTFSVLSNNVILNVPCGYGSIYDNTAIWHNFDIQEDLMYTFSATPGNPARGTVGVIHAPECSNLQAEVQAYPYNGFHFARWSDGNTEAHRYLVVLHDTAIEAIFLAEGETEGINDVNTDGFSVWSTNGRIHVSLDGEPVKEFRVYDLIGRKVFHANNADETSALPGGVYLVKVDMLPAKKVVVIR